MRILVVDDDVLIQRILQHTLTAAGHEVEIAGNGRAALEILRRGTCRVVISDWMMPEMDGLELCRRVRAQDSPGYVYIILLTSQEGSQNMIEARTAGADDFITKPVSPQELIVRLATAERTVVLESRDLVIFAMAKLAESRDPETGAHLERVRNYSRLLGEDLSRRPTYTAQVTPAMIKLLYLTTPLHDIGKVAIPDHVLLKPGRLSDREFEIMKTHTTMGAQTLEAALRDYPEATFLSMARDVAIGHHERWDGSGYPNRLAGEAIPLSARIMAVADVYDALTSKRVYKAAFTHDVAKAMIVKESGTHFDPALVESFLAAEAKFIEIYDRFAELREAA